MNALRWILLVAGVALLVGLLWRGRARSTQAAGTAQEGRPAPIDSLARTGAVRNESGEFPPFARDRVRRELPVINWSALEAAESAADAASVPSTSAGAGVGAVTKTSIDAPLEATSQRVGSVTGGAPSTAEVRIPTVLPVSAPERVVVHWPPEAERRICTVRLLPRVKDRFAGRQLRQSFASLGLLPGPFGIFHLPDEQGVSMLCVANMAKPGMLDPEQLDFQSFTGLALFTVLPGKLPDSEQIEQLVHTARDLAQRLDGRLQDERGAPLGALQLAELRALATRMPPALGEGGGGA